jgi:hypothetical protein
MANGPTFTPADVFTAPLGDALDELLAADREQRAAMARKVAAVVKAHWNRSVALCRATACSQTGPSALRSPLC